MSDVIWGAGNVWLSDVVRPPDDPHSLNMKILDAVALGLTALRVTGTRDALTGDADALLGDQTQIDRGITILNACFNAGLKVLFGFSADPADLAGASDQDIQAGGAAWAERIAQEGLEAVVIGFKPQNEMDLSVEDAYNTWLDKYPNDEAGAYAAADNAALAHARIITNFCDGTRADLPSAARLPGGVTGTNIPTGWAARALRPMAQAWHDGTLTGLCIHWYRSRDRFQIHFATPTEAVATLEGLPLAQRTTALIEAVFAQGAPPPPSLGVYVDECNVQWDTFDDAGWTAEQRFTATAAAMGALLDALLADGRVALVYPFSPWPPVDKKDRYLISLHYPHRPQAPETPMGVVVQEYATVA